MNLIWTLMLVSVGLMELLSAEHTPSTYTIITDSVVACEGKSPLWKSQFQIKRTFSRNVAFDVNLTIYEDLHYPPKVRLSLQKCYSKINRESCETMWRFVSKKNSCEQMKQPGHAWSELAKKMKPRFSCPWLKGEYFVENYEVSSPIMTRFLNPRTIGDFFLIIQLSLLNKLDEVLFCQEFIFYRVME